MSHSHPNDSSPGFPPTIGTPIAFTPKGARRAPPAGVRESGHGPDDPDGRRRPCWHHDDPHGCTALGNKLALDQQTRHLTSIGIDLVVWTHARTAVGPAPLRRFLERFEPNRRWQDGATPPLGLARGAVLYHLPVGENGRTAAELFEESRLFRRLCPAEREWLAAERHARLSIFEVRDVARDGVLLRDCFRELSGRRDLVLHPGEIAREHVAIGHTVFARVVRFRNRNYVDLLQADTSKRSGMPDPYAPAHGVWRSPHPLRDREGMLTALFEAWQRDAAPLAQTDS